MIVKTFNNSDVWLHKEYQNLLDCWVEQRNINPKCRLFTFKDSKLIDLTPKNFEQLRKMRDIQEGSYFVVDTVMGPIALWVAVAAVAAFAVYTYLTLPTIDQNLNDNSSGSPNNSLSSRQNKSRPGERVPDIFGRVKCIPDLVSLTFRYYKDNVQVEEGLYCLGVGFYDVNIDEIKESDTPIVTIEGASFSMYNPNVPIISTPSLQHGETFYQAPKVAKAVNSVDGKQVLLPPNSSMVIYKGCEVSGNTINVVQPVQYTEDYLVWNPSFISGARWERESVDRVADFSSVFSPGESVIISNAYYGSAPDVVLSGNATILLADHARLSIETSQIVYDALKYKKTRVSAFLIVDPLNGLLDLSGEYNILDVQKTSTGYDLILDNPIGTNYNWSRLSQDAVDNISAVLTNHVDNLDLSGTYTIASMTATSMTLASPSVVNPAWSRLSNLTSEQRAEFLSRNVVFKGSNENFIGWYYAGNTKTTGFMVNFLASNGIYEGDKSKQVAIEVQYQAVDANNEPISQIYKVGATMSGLPNNRSPVGMTIEEYLPFVGPFRFRVMRVNDNGSSASLIDTVILESVYSFYHSQKIFYPHTTMLRLRRLAIGSGTNAIELNLIATRKLYTYASGSRSLDMIPTTSFADAMCQMALDPRCGNMTIDELDIESIYNMVDTIIDYFGIEEMAEFNCTFDSSDISYQEQVFALAYAVGCVARREKGLHFLKFEKKTEISKLLFNSTTVKPDSLTVSENFGIENNYYGLEVEWQNKDNDFVFEKFRVPDDFGFSYKSLKLTGVTNEKQAKILAFREWFKMRYACRPLQFDAYQLHNLVDRADKVLVADLTKPILLDGTIEDFSGINVTLDQHIELPREGSYMIHLQLKDGSTDVIDIADFSGDTVVLARLPNSSLTVSDAYRSSYTIVEASDDTSCDAYLIQHKEPKSSFEATMSVINYDDRYYQEDFRYKVETP